MTRIRVGKMIVVEKGDYGGEMHLYILGPLWINVTKTLKRR